MLTNQASQKSTEKMPSSAGVMKIESVHPANYSVSSGTEKALIGVSRAGIRSNLPRGFLIPVKWRAICLVLTIFNQYALQNRVAEKAFREEAWHEGVQREEVRCKEVRREEAWHKEAWHEETWKNRVAAKQVTLKERARREAISSD